ncbi:MAG: TerC family protein [Acidobacteria bacterium]|nr:TerC family protein [Acidobacteriota bacterium]
MQGVGTPLLWIGFTVFVLGMLALDLGVFHRKAHAVGHREAFLWTVVWVSLAISFNVWIFLQFGTQHGLEFLTGYLIEYSLSIDNIFVFIIIFRYFSVPAASQHRALFWGILGALVMRALFILLGAALIEAFHWIIYVFGAFLVYTGYKMVNGHDMEVHPERNPIVRLFQRAIPITSHYEGSRMLVRQRGRLMATPLLLVLAVIEGTDLVFAVDSIPAIFAVTRDTFIVYTSNIFAILGLRSLYFLLAGAMTKIQYLKIGLGAVLSFVGVKMLISEYYKIPILFSLGVITGLLGAAVLASFIRPMRTASIPRGDVEDPLHVKEPHLKSSPEGEA